MCASICSPNWLQVDFDAPGPLVGPENHHVRSIAVLTM